MAERHPSLREEVSAIQLNDAKDELCYVLTYTDDPSISECVTPDQYKVLELLDGVTSWERAIELALQQGILPIGLELVVQRLASKGFFNDPYSEWFKPEPANSSPLRHLLRTHSILWRDNVAKLRFSGAAAKILIKVANALNKTWLLCALLLAGLVMGWYFTEEIIRRNVEGNLVLSSLWIAVIAVVCIVWIVWNASHLVISAAASTAKDSPNIQAFLSIRLGLPMLAVRKDALETLPWFRALSARLAGPAAICVIASLVTASLLAAQNNAVASLLNLIGLILIGVVLVQLSPWWPSLLTSATAQALEGYHFPKDALKFFGRKFVPWLISTRRHSEAESIFLLYTFFMLAWSFLVLRVMSRLSEGMLPTLYGKAMQNQNPYAEKWIFGAASIFAVLAGAMLLTLVLAGIGQIIGRVLGPEGAISIRARTIASVAFALVGGLFASLADPNLRPHLVLVLMIAIASNSGFRVQAFSSNQRNVLSPACLGLLSWSALYLLTQTANTLELFDLDLGGPNMPRAGLLLLGTACLLPISTLLAVRGRSISIALLLTIYLTLLALTATLNIDYPTYAATLAGAALICAIWSVVHGPGDYSRLTAWMGGGIAFLFVSALLVRYASSASEFESALSGGMELSAWTLFLMCSPIASELRAPITRSEEYFQTPVTSERIQLRDAARVLLDSVLFSLSTVLGQRVATRVKGALKANSPGLFLLPTNDPSEESAFDTAVLSADFSRAINLLTALGSTLVGSNNIKRILEAQLSTLNWRTRQRLGELGLASTQAGHLLAGVPTADLEQMMRSTIRVHPMFASFDEPALENLIERAHLLRYESGAPIVRQGESDTSLFLLVSGSALVIEEDFAGTQHLRLELRSGDYFGELGLIFGQPRTATVQAHGETWAVRLSKGDLLSAGINLPEIDKLDAAAMRRIKLVRDVPLFRSLSPDQVHILAENSAIVTYRPGETVIKQGEPGDSFFIIAHGKVEVSVDGQALRELGDRDYFGEIALLLNVSRTATVTAIEQTECVKVPGRFLRRLTEENVQVFHHLQQVAFRRIQN